MGRVPNLNQLLKNDNLTEIHHNTSINFLETSPSVDKVRTFTDQKFLFKIEKKDQVELQGDQYECYKPLNVYFPSGLLSIWKSHFDYFCPTKIESCNAKSRRLLILPDVWFGGKPLVFPIDKSDHVALRHWEKEDNNNLPFYKFIKPSSDSLIEEYSKRMSKDMTCDKNDRTLDPKNCLERSDEEWMKLLPRKDIKMMKKIMRVSDSTEAYEKIKKFLHGNGSEKADEITKRLIRCRAFRIEEFIHDSLPYFYGYICQKPNDPKDPDDSEDLMDPEDPPQMCRLSLVFKVASAFNGQHLDGALIIPLLPKIFKVRTQNRNRKLIHVWMPGTAYIKPFDYLDTFEWSTIFRASNPMRG